MTTVSIGRPRRIDPSLIELGDDISVEHEMDRGLINTSRGIVDKVVPINNKRHFFTSEGATILTWVPGGANKVKITLYGRAVKVQDTLFDAMDVLRERIAS